MPLSLITGATAGLGRALAVALDDAGHDLVLDGRDPARLDELRADLPRATVIGGDVTDPEHRQALVDAVGGRGLDLLVHNASTLGRSPLPHLAQLDHTTLRAVLEVNLVAPHALTTAVLDQLQRAGGTVLTLSSDAAVEHYESWGGYGASKAALDHLAGTLGAEHPGLRVYAVDPGDMRTAMHQAAFPNEDISARPLPEDLAVPGILALLRDRPDSGRYRAAELIAESEVRA
ncbi:SDR family NAD(P)-dependent oxidoreductase [Serinicoccus kebangsaanensis]|uniref:SDR family NAD(P)-dependent oxidoreductase n=1 Tax=Serinicoccus kebangsaanensis TaxID=2602069 RepID=UPI00124BD1D3|nr:SDR family oxidoreductase [Serinicoccus kebangsaanensis]